MTAVTATGSLEAMFERLDRSIQLFSLSWAVLRDEKSLALYPVISVITGLAVTASFAWPVLTMFADIQTTTDAYGTSHASLSMHPLGWFVAGVGYFLLVYVGIFCNAALIYAANERLTGTGPGDLASGFSGAWRRAGAFVPWALLSATVSVLLRWLEERAGILGRIAIAAVGIAWNLVTYMVVPVLVLEDTPSTGRALKRSSLLFRETWGENVVGNIGFGLFQFLVAIVAVGLVMLGIMSGVAATLVLLAVIAFAVLLIGNQIIATMSGIYRVSLYRYAVDGVGPGPYVSFDFDLAFRPKKAGGLVTKRRAGRPFADRPPTGDPLARQPYRAWTPPPPEPVEGAYGIAIPGQDSFPGIPDEPGIPPTARPTPPAGGPHPPGGSDDGPWGAPGSSPRGF